MSSLIIINKMGSKVIYIYTQNHLINKCRLATDSKWVWQVVRHG